MFPLLALAALTSDARAEAVIEFKTSGPVGILVDGQQATMMSNLRQRATGLNAGVHQLEISGMFGKKLYEAEIDIPDNTITYVAWEKGEIKVLKTEWLEEEPVAEEVVAAEPPPEVPAESLEVPLPLEEPLPLAAPAELPIAAVPAELPGDELPVAAAPMVEAVALPAPKSRTLTVQAYDGMHVEIVNGDHKVVVVVEGTSFRIEDANGLNVALSSE